MNSVEFSVKDICHVDWGNTKLTKSSYVSDGKFVAVSAAGADGLIDHYEHEPNVPVLSAIGAQCGRMFFPGVRFTAIKNTITLTPKGQKVDGKFLYYLFWHIDLPQRGAGQPFISKGDIEAFRVRIPETIKEQREIVKKLDSAFEEIDRGIQNSIDSKDHLEDFFQLFLVEMIDSLILKFGSTEMGKVLEIARGGSPRPINSFITDEADGVNWIKISDATASKKFINRTAQKIKQSGVTKSRLVKPGDFLLSNSMSFGRPYIMGTTGCIHDGWLVLSDEQKLFNQDYLYHVLGSKFIYDQFDRAAAGSTVRNLNIQLAGQVKLPVPDQVTQETMALKVARIEIEVDALKSALERKQALLVELKKSLLSKYLSEENITGEMDYGAN